MRKCIFARRQLQLYLFAEFFLTALSIQQALTLIVKSWLGWMFDILCCLLLFPDP